MVITSTRFDPRERLRIIARSLRDLHRTLLEYQRREYEKHFGRINSDIYVVQLASEDPEFAWLRALSAEMIKIDVAIGEKEPISEADLRLAAARIRYLLTPDVNGTSFQNHYDRAMQVNPDIVMAHAAALRSLPPSREVRLFRSQSSGDVRTYDEAPGFEVRFHHPGELLPGHGDHGLHALAVIGESFMSPGTMIPMHRHSNEEIISWVPDGVMRHDDGEGNRLVTNAGHLMVMNAGAGFEHAEMTNEDDPPLRMLQIFVRPSALQLEPGIQHAALPESMPGTWRNLVGPEDSDYPFHVRNAIEMLDVVLDEGGSVDLPRRDGWYTVFFVHDGEVEVDDVPYTPAQKGLVLSPHSVRMSTPEGARVVAFLINPMAKVTRAGTVGN